MEKDKLSDIAKDCFEAKIMLWGPRGFTRGSLSLWWYWVLRDLFL
jgi:hypothetical protein